MPTRHYDERREKLDEIKRKYNKEVSSDETYKPSRRDFRGEWENRNLRGNSSRSSSLRLIIILGLLMFLAWFFLLKDNRWIELF
jgi:cytoskeletal protein RodZ